MPKNGGQVRKCEARLTTCVALVSICAKFFAKSLMTA
jgi:hypothetical protein